MSFPPIDFEDHFRTLQALKFCRLLIMVCICECDFGGSDFVLYFFVLYPLFCFILLSLFFCFHFINLVIFCTRRLTESCVCTISNSFKNYSETLQASFTWSVNAHVTLGLW